MDKENLENLREEIIKKAVVLNNMLIIENEGISLVPVSVGLYVEAVAKIANKENPDLKLEKIPVTKNKIVDLLEMATDIKEDDKFFIEKYSIYQCEHKDVLLGIKKAIVDLFIHEIEEETKSKKTAFAMLNLMVLNIQEATRAGYLSSISKKREASLNGKLEKDKLNQHISKSRTKI